MASVNFAEVTELGQREDWDGVADILAEAARGVEKAGADFLMLCTTTFHRVAEQFEAAVDIPLLHLAYVIAGEAPSNRVENPALIGPTCAFSCTFFTSRFPSTVICVVVPAASTPAPATP